MVLHAGADAGLAVQKRPNVRSSVRDSVVDLIARGVCNRTHHSVKHGRSRSEDRPRDRLPSFRPTMKGLEQSLTTMSLPRRTPATLHQLSPSTLLLGSSTLPMPAMANLWTREESSQKLPIIHERLRTPSRNQRSRSIPMLPPPNKEQSTPRRSYSEDHGRMIPIKPSTAEIMFPEKMSDALTPDSGRKSTILKPGGQAQRPVTTNVDKSAEKRVHFQITLPREKEVTFRVPTRKGSGSSRAVSEVSPENNSTVTPVFKVMVTTKNNVEAKPPTADNNEKAKIVASPAEALCRTFIDTHKLGAPSTPKLRTSSLTVDHFSAIDSYAGHVNYCDHKKTDQIVKWLEDVNEQQNIDAKVRRSLSSTSSEKISV
ncbi:uncharacterized protein LOC144909889 [Branchiostoma floridae x Branchiostoma belcheri]